MTDISALWPLELRLNPAKDILTVSFSDGTQASLSAELLRVHSPSAEVQGHSPSEKKLVSGKARVQVTGIEPVGNYAVRLTFSDGHSTGIYSWGYLHELGQKRELLWSQYLRELDAAQLSRGI